MENLPLSLGVLNVNHSNFITDVLENNNREVYISKGTLILFGGKLKLLAPNDAWIPFEHASLKMT